MLAMVKRAGEAESNRAVRNYLSEANFVVKVVFIVHLHLPGQRLLPYGPVSVDRCCVIH